MRRQLTSLFVLLYGAFLCGIFCSTAYGFSTLSNATTQVNVYGGEANNGLVPSGGYFDYIDLASAVQTTWSVDPVFIVGGVPIVLSNGSAGGFGSPADIGGGLLESTATAGNFNVSAVTELINSAARTTFTFTKIDSNGPDLDGSTFVFYAENDILSFNDDTAEFTGSIAGNDLALYQFDTIAGGLTVKLTAANLGNAPITLFGSGLWTGFGTAIEAGDLSVLSADGSNFVGQGDLGLAIAFSLSGSTAVVQVDYDTQPNVPGVPEPASLTLIAASVFTLLLRRNMARN